MDFPFLGKKSQKNKIEKIKTDKIVPNPHQPRSEFSEENLQKLAESIENFGIIQPLIVSEKDDKYQLIAGERRLRAVKKDEQPKIAAVILEEVSPEKFRQIQLIENLQRKDLNFLEEAQAYQQLLNEFDLTQKELAARVSKSQSTIANKLRLLNLPDSVQKELVKANLSERHGRALLNVDSKIEQLELVEEIIKKDCIHCFNRGRRVVRIKQSFIKPIAKGKHHQ